MADYASGYDPKYGYNRNAFAHKTPATYVIGKILQGITTPIGLASEAIASSKDKKRSKSDPDAHSGVPSEQVEELKTETSISDTTEATSDHQQQGSEDYGIDRDETTWALDEAAADDAKNKKDDEEAKSNTAPEITDLISSIQPGGPPAYQRGSQMPFPVIIPQRRPGTKTRGFVRAYAPVLQDSGIDEAMFLNFLKSFHRASQASPIFDVIIISCNLASNALIINPVIGAIAGAGIFAVQMGAYIGQEMQERWRTNEFLDAANQDIFMPRGLFAMIVMYEQSVDDSMQYEKKTVDIGATALAKYGDSLLKSGDVDIEGEEGEKATKKDEIKEKMKRLRIQSGKTREAEMPVNCAPLVFPAMEAAANSAEKGDQSGLEKMKASSKGASKFVNQYMDRRAQATFNANNKDSTLASMTPAPQFKSKIADPNDARNTHFITLITGGKIEAEPLGAKRRYEKAQRKAAEQRAKGLKTKSTKRGLQEDVLYLMIVNTPSAAELEKARQDLKVAKEKKKTDGHVDAANAS